MSSSRTSWTHSTFHGCSDLQGKQHGGQDWRDCRPEEEQPVGPCAGVLRAALPAHPGPPAGQPGNGRLHDKRRQAGPQETRPQQPQFTHTTLLLRPDMQRVRGCKAKFCRGYWFRYIRLTVIVDVYDALQNQHSVLSVNGRPYRTDIHYFSSEYEVAIKSIWKDDYRACV